MICLTPMFKAGVALAGTALMAVVAGCGVQSASPSASAPPIAYHVTVDESLPSSPQPITVVWKGTLPYRGTTFSRLTEQIGQSPSMTVVPVPQPKTAPASLTSSTKSSAATKPKAAANHAVQVPAVVNPTAAVPGLLKQEITAITGAHAVLPTNPMPLVDAPLANPIALSFSAHIQKTWRDSVTLGSTVVPATVSLTTNVAKPQGIFRQASWTLVMTTQSIQVKPKKGKPYFIPSLTWTERGTVTPVGP